MLVQVASAGLSFDETAPGILIRSMQREGSGTYSHLLMWFLTFFLTCRGVNWNNILYVASAVSTWAIIGPPDLLQDFEGHPRSSRDIKFLCPAYRMSFALQVLSENGLANDDPNSILLMLDKNANTIPFPEAIQWMTHTLEQRVGHYASYAQQIDGREEFKLAGDMIEFIVKQRREMAKRFLSSPSEYIRPEEYLKNVEGYPSPPIRQDFTGKEFPLGYNGPDADSVANGVFDGFKAVDGTTVIKSHLLHVPDGLRNETLHAFESLHVFTDFHLTGIAPPQEAEALRLIWGELGLTIVNV